MLALAAALAVALRVGSTAAAPYPISPQPLRLLVQESDFVVVARVREAEAWRTERALTEEARQLGASSVVVLEIDRLVVGDPGVGAIEQVLYGWTCPSPARYEPGTRVLAFLDRGRDGGFETSALSYGAKTLGDAELAVYLQRIREQVAIQELDEGERRLAEQVEWLVKCAEHPATRWEGAYELAPKGDSMSEYDRIDPPRDFARHLSASQRERLRATLLSAGSLGSGERCLEELFREDPDPRIQAWLVRELRERVEEGAVASYDHYDALELARRIARRSADPAVREVVDEIERLRFERDAHSEREKGRLTRELLARI